MIVLTNIYQSVSMDMLNNLEIDDVIVLLNGLPRPNSDGYYIPPVSLRKNYLGDIEVIIGCSKEYKLDEE